MGKKYYFINKENLRRSAERISDLVEKMYETFQEFKEVKDVLCKDSLIELTNLDSRAGLTDKLVKKLEKAVENFRSLYVERMNDIFQTTIEDFVKKKEDE